MNNNFSLLPLVKPIQAQTSDWQSINENCVQDGTATIQGIGCVLANVLSVVLTLIGIAGFVMIIYAAFTMLLSAGKSQQVDKAKNTITFAIIGIILALSAFIIINLLASFTGIDTLKSLSIPGSERNWF
jgi:phage shock protein PspC (stress-responsive transcriptional regulator)